jgi:hypothetical protein
MYSCMEDFRPQHSLQTIVSGFLLCFGTMKVRDFLKFGNIWAVAGGGGGEGSSGVVARARRVHGAAKQIF